MQVLGIVGLDYCGSTVISNVLSGLPGTVNVGESHWIIDRGIGCKECGRKPCPIFTNRLLSRLRNEDIDSGMWWEIISKETGSELIISSDKLPKHYDRFGTPDFLLFVHKDPRANIYSWCKRKFSSSYESESIFSTEEINSGIEWWKKVTRDIVEWMEEQTCEIAVISLEDFARNPREMVRGISTWVASDFDPSTVEFWRRELHYIGGNHSVKRMNPDRHFFNRIDIDERWKEGISDTDSSRIMQSREINSLLERAKKTSQI
tara:strand:- start:343 stop:1128 length:786 start_codon:yes stop_codon:yes gene_type:complete